MIWKPIAPNQWAIEYLGKTYYTQWDDQLESTAWLWEQGAGFDLRTFMGSKADCLTEIKRWQKSLPEILMEDAL